MRCKLIDPTQVVLAPFPEVSLELEPANQPTLRRVDGVGDQYVPVAQ
jgi:hypothetical protein